MTPRARRVARAACAFVLAPPIALAVAAVMTPLPPELAAGAKDDSVVFTDREGEVLREVRAGDASRARWVSLDETGPWVGPAIVAAEDGRFEAHPGVDAVAAARAAGQAVWHRRVVSGASTLTMQLARLVRPHPKTLAGKLGEMALALRIEASLSKRAVLEQYANRAPFGPQVRGVEAASRYWFDKPSARLSLAEAATLAAIPRGPTLYDVGKHPDRVLRRRDRVLDRMLAAGTISAAEHDRAVAEPLSATAPRGSFGAPHFISAVWNGSVDGHPPRGPVVRTTLDVGLQRVAERAVAANLAPLASRHVTQGSVVVVDNATGDVLAYVGSAAWDDQDGGRNDGARAKRQPGSALKPFVYGLAFERGVIDAATPLADVEHVVPIAGHGTWEPHNYDGQYHGPVRAREALANSLNVPAVKVLEQVGVAPALGRLRELGFASLTEDAETYGPGLVLGDGEVTALELARAYATLARGGMDLPLRVVADAPLEAPRRVMPEAAADLVADVLADKDARLASFGERTVLELSFPVAAKTGTSKAYRDNWAAGFTREVTVVAWVGNFDGSSMERVTGITGAGPIFRAVMGAAMQGRAPGPLGVRPEDGLVRAHVCPLSGGAPGAACAHHVSEWLPADKAGRRETCRMHESVAIDRRNGLRAGPGCAPAFVELRTFERHDGELLAWARGAHRDLAPDAFSPLCPGAMTSAQGALAIQYPADGTRLVVDPGLPLSTQSLGVRLTAPSGVRATLEVDGREVGAASSALVVRWPIRPGRHVLVARAPGLPASAPVAVEVLD